MLNESKYQNIRSIAKTTKSKFDKYWDDVNKMKKVLFIAIILDSRFKIYLSFILKRIYEDDVSYYIRSMGE